MSTKLLIAIIVGVILAFATLWLFEGDAQHVYVIGQVFLRSLQMLIVPLIVLSVISGVVEIGGGRALGSLGAKTVAYYGGTMLLAASLGLLVVNLLAPGVGVETGAISEEHEKRAEQVGVSDFIDQLLGSNVVESMANMEILPVILFSLLFGISLVLVGDDGKPLVRVIQAGNRAIMKMVVLIMWLAPVGIYGLVAGRFGKALAEGGTEAFFDQLGAVGEYVGAVLLALAAHALIVLPLLLLLLARRNPLRFLRGMTGALFTAGATASSSATLPVTLDNVVEENGVDSRTARFVLPLGSTVNMDGSALYEAMAALFVAQVAGIELGLGEQAIVVLTSALAAMGAAGIPEAGLVTLLIVLKSVNLPLSGLELLLPVDWFLDRFRTAVNVWGDAVGAAVVDEST